MGLSSTDLREIKSIVSGVFNDKFLQEIADKVAKMVEKRYEEQLKEQQRQVSLLRDELGHLKQENISLRNHLDNQEQSMRNDNIRIFGLKAEDSDYTLQEKVLDLFNNKLNANISSSAIKKCYRVTRKIPNAKPPAVIVNFSSSDARISVLKMRKYLKNTGVFIKEDLTKQRLSLYEHVKSIFTYKHCWILNGCVYVKCDDNAVHRINSEQDLIALRPPE